MYDVVRLRTMRCGQLQGDLAGAALGLTRQPGVGGNGATRLILSDQVTGRLHECFVDMVSPQANLGQQSGSRCWADCRRMALDVIGVLREG